MSLPIAHDTYLNDEYLQRVEGAELAQPKRLADGVTIKPYTLLSIDEVEAIPKPTWLVEGMLPVSSFCVMYGPPGAGKTFLALDLALSVASGRPFFGRSVRRGAVVYVGAEGKGGMGARVKAWREHRGATFGIQFYMLPEPVQLLDAGNMTRLTHTIATSFQTPPAMVVFDTFARCFMGGEENSAKEMGVAISAADELRRRTDACVAFVHHTNKAGEQERGSIALRGAADTMIAVREKDNRMVFECDKQKDSEPFAEVHVQLAKVGDSLVPTIPNSAPTIGRADMDFLEVLERSFPTGPATSTEWLDASGKPKTNFYRARGRLLKFHMVAESKDGRSVRYSVTPDGHDALYHQRKDDGVPTDSHAIPTSRDSGTVPPAGTGSVPLGTDPGRGTTGGAAGSGPGSHAVPTIPTQFPLSPDADAAAEIDERLGIRSDR